MKKILLIACLLFALPIVGNPRQECFDRVQAWVVQQSALCQTEQCLQDVVNQANEENALCLLFPEGN